MRIPHPLFSPKFRRRIGYSKRRGTITLTCDLRTLLLHLNPCGRKVILRVLSEKKCDFWYDAKITLPINAYSGFRSSMQQPVTDLEKKRNDDDEMRNSSLLPSFRRENGNEVFPSLYHMPYLSPHG